jgi:hypothetical protein
MVVKMEPISRIEGLCGVAGRRAWSWRIEGRRPAVLATEPFGSNPLGSELGEQGFDLGHARLHTFGHTHGDRLLHPFE